MTPDQLDDLMRRHLTQILTEGGKPVPAVDRGTPLQPDLPLDSLDWADFTVRMQESLGVDPFVQGVPSGLRTLGDLAALYERALAS